MKCTFKIWKKNDEKISTRKISLAMKSFAKDILQIILNRKENLWNQWNSYFFYFQVLHQDIESHSQLIKTVLVQCAQLAEKHKKKYKNRERSAASHKRISILLSVGKIIEKRWHCLWLRSLEWQCFLEQFTSTSCSQKVRRHEGYCSNQFEEFSCLS